MHEATRKLLGVLLREMDGFDAGKKSIVIGATNRRADLVPRSAHWLVILCDVKLQALSAPCHNLQHILRGRCQPSCVILAVGPGPAEPL
jgi:SpoVK/Ycf46/Vps4 family AAA+-type ATPase